MDIMRIILIVFGVLLVAGIYLVDRIKRSKAAEARDRWEDDPEFDTETTGDASFTTVEDELPDEWVGKAVTLTPTRHERLADEQLEELKGLAMRLTDDDTSVTESQKPETRDVKSEAVAPDDVIVLTVMAGENKVFRGPVLLKVLQEVGLEHGEMDLFHYYLSGHKIPLFSVANILEPGRFDLSELVELETPGLALFMRLPAIVDGEQALAALLQKSRQMAAQLSGTLCDERRYPLDDAALVSLQEKAQPYKTI